MSKILVVVGATGLQGGSVIRTVLNDAQLKKEFTIRAVTRNPNSPQSEKLKELSSGSGGAAVEVVRADTNDDDLSALTSAFKDAHTVFAATVTIYDGHTYEHELKTGKRLADAAVSAGVKYLIYSTLPDGSKISNGKYKNTDHFNAKAATERYIRTLSSNGLLRSAFVAPASFMSNLEGGFLKPRAVVGAEGKGGGMYAITSFLKPDTPVHMIDVKADLGTWVAVILSDPDRYEGKVLCAATTPPYTYRQVAAAISKVTGKKVVYKQIPTHEWEALLPPATFRQLDEMFAIIEEFGYFGAAQARGGGGGSGGSSGEDHGKMNEEEQEDGVEWSIQQVKKRGGKLTSLEEYLNANPIRFG